MSVKTNHMLGLGVGIACFCMLGGCNNTSSNQSVSDDTVASYQPQGVSGDQEGSSEVVSYPLILPATQIPGTIDDSLVKHLPAHIKALAAFYAAMGGTDCDGENCALTSALELGKQGSDEQKSLIRTYFPQDKVADAVLAQNCYLRPSGASSFTEFAYLTIRDYGDSVLVDYELFSYDRGKGERTPGPDVYEFNQGKFKNKSRKIWTFVGAS